MRPGSMLKIGFSRPLFLSGCTYFTARVRNALYSLPCDDHEDPPSPRRVHFLIREALQMILENIGPEIEGNFVKVIVVLSRPVSQDIMRPTYRCDCQRIPAFRRHHTRGLWVL